MLKFVIYDEEGRIVFSKLGHETGDLETVNIEEPPGKRLVSMDPITKEPVFEDIPKDAITLLNEVKEKLEQQEEMSAELETALYDMAEVLQAMFEGGGE